jgi:hypothetical protein
MTDGQDGRMVDPSGDGETENLPAGSAEIPGKVYLLPSAAGSAGAAGAGGFDELSDSPAWPALRGAVEAPENDSDSTESDSEDWAWVQEWREGHEPTPWMTGLPLAIFASLVVAVAIWVLSAGLSDRPVVAVLVNLLVAGGLAPAVWLSRGLPVLRWIAAGCAAGVIIGWICAILMLPLPA